MPHKEAINTVTATTAKQVANILFSNGSHLLGHGIGHLVTFRNKKSHNLWLFFAFGIVIISF
jgi:hypothetical protein